MTYEIGNNTIEFINVEDYGRNEETGELIVNRTAQLSILEKLTLDSFEEKAVKVGNITYLLFLSRKKTGSDSYKITIEILAKDTEEGD